MNTPESLNTESKNLFNLISKNWEELDDSLKTVLIKIDATILNYLNLPDWALSFIGFGQ